MRCMRTHAASRPRVPYGISKCWTMIVDRRAIGVLMSIALAPLLFADAVSSTPVGQTAAAQYLDASSGRDWPGYGRTFGQQHYSPLSQINETNASRLGLVWSMELGRENSVTEPIAVDGLLYFATGL